MTRFASHRGGYIELDGSKINEFSIGVPADFIKLLDELNEHCMAKRLFLFCTLTVPSFALNHMLQTGWEVKDDLLQRSAYNVRTSFNPVAV